MAAGAYMWANWFITGFVGSAAEKIEKISLLTTSGGADNPRMLTASSVAVALLIVGIAELVMRRTGRIVGLGRGRADAPSADRLTA